MLFLRHAQLMRLDNKIKISETYDAARSASVLFMGINQKQLMTLLKGNTYFTTGVTSGAGTAYPSRALEFTPGFSGIRATRSLLLYVCFVNRHLYFWLLHCLFFFDIRIQITPLLSSTSS